MGFTGHEDDTELGLVNMGGRLYDPKLARFLQPDAMVQAPGFSQSWNPYGYVWHSPLRYTDPSGWQVEPGQAGQGPPVVSNPYYRDENGAPYVCATPGCNLVTMTPEPPWTNGEDTTGPTPYGAQPQAAPAASPSQPAWSMSDAQFYSIVTPGNHLDYDSRGVAIPSDPTATLLELGVLAAPFLVDLAPVLAAAAPELFGALSELGLGLLEGTAGLPGGTLAPAGVGAVVGSGSAGSTFGRLGNGARSLSTGGGAKGPSMKTVGQAAMNAARAQCPLGDCKQLSVLVGDELAKRGVSSQRVFLTPVGGRGPLPTLPGVTGTPWREHAGVLLENGQVLDPLKNRIFSSTAEFAEAYVGQTPIEIMQGGQLSRWP